MFNCHNSGNQILCKSSQNDKSCFDMGYRRFLFKISFFQFFYLTPKMGILQLFHSAIRSFFQVEKLSKMKVTSTSNYTGL